MVLHILNNDHVSACGIASCYRRRSRRFTLSGSAYTFEFPRLTGRAADDAGGRLADVAVNAGVLDGTPAAVFCT